MRRAGLALVPVLALAFAWLHVERPPDRLGAAAMAALATVSVLPSRSSARAALALGAAAAGIAIAVDASLTHPRAVIEEPWRGLVTFYQVTLPFDPARDPEMGAVVLITILALSLAVAHLAAAGWTVAAVVVAAPGIAWPATLLGGAHELAYGALALGVALWLVLGARRRAWHARAGGVAVAGAAIVAATVVAGSSAGPTAAGLDWKRWNLVGDHGARVAVSYVWDADYDGVSFPTSATTVLRVRTDARPRYWRAATLDWFSGDRWLERLRPLGTASGRGRVPSDPLRPSAANRTGTWLEQRVEIAGLRDTRLVATGTLVAYDLRTHGTTLLGQDGSLRVPVGLRRGDRYDAWSYVPDPVPRALAALPPAYPAAADRYLELFGTTLPRFGAAGRDAMLEALIAGGNRTAARYRPVYVRARQLAGQERSPYRVVLAVESWLRSRGGLRYDEQPVRLRTPRSRGLPPLVDFLTVTKAGYCQHFAGTMALMLRMLGIPSRVAVGFTSGSFRNGTWVVTDHDAHAWVEVWFPGHGWLPFDPTPGRGRLSGAYSFASESARAVDELGRGRLPGADEVARLTREPVASTSDGRGPTGLIVPALLVLLAAGLTVLVAVKLLRVRLRYAAREPRRRATAAHAELVGFLRDQGLDVGRTSTLTDLRAAVAAAYGVQLDAFALAAGRARFGRAVDADDARRARAELRRSLRALRARLGPWRRLRGAFSVRSLRNG